MILPQLAGITAVSGTIAYLEWRHLRTSPRKDRGVFLAFIGIGWLMAALLVIFPKLPGPTTWLDALFKPLFKWMSF
ncbi:hypothetical protein [Tumebacillus flagellatus]|uniref:Uncharacterized protein n=1 Tax=Tumebacillus flagellatus TaxID=1157490 RepID=A0A074LXI9_9BACL|nr:hypothetical protein [Tumebacillus flagellatus]KEO84833.1 hypothetical protein EL26_02140 [Tumebacillus flagellatus]